MRISIATEMQGALQDGRPDAAATFANTLEQIVLADRLGFHAAWVTEHHFQPEFSVAAASDQILAAAARLTKRIRLGAGVVVLPYHHPLHVAERMASIDLLSHGRLEFGIGRGNVYAQTGHGVDPKNTRAMTAEALACILAMWKSYPDEFQWDGAFWQIPPRLIAPQPLQDPPPLWMACAQEQTYAVAADLGLAVQAFIAKPPETHKPLIDAYRKRIAITAAEGRYANPVWGTWAFAACARDGAAARRQIKDAMTAFFRPTRHYAEAARQLTKDLLASWGGVMPDDLKAHLSVPLGSSLQADETPRLPPWEAMDSDALAACGMSVAGTPEQCIEGLKLYEAAGVDEVMIFAQTEQVSHESVMQTIQLIGEDVLPAFHKH